MLGDDDRPCCGSTLFQRLNDSAHHSVPLQPHHEQQFEQQFGPTYTDAVSWIDEYAYDQTGTMGSIGYSMSSGVFGYNVISGLI